MSMPKCEMPQDPDTHAARLPVWPGDIFPRSAHSCSPGLSAFEGLATICLLSVVSVEGAHMTVRTDTSHQISCAHMLVLGCVCAEGVVFTVGSKRVMTVSEATGGERHQLSSPAKAHRAGSRGSLGKVQRHCGVRACGPCGGSGEGKTRLQDLNSSEMWELWAPGMGALSGSLDRTLGAVIEMYSGNPVSVGHALQSW